MGLDSPSGHLCAVHRSMRWGRHLLLKGVFVDQSSRGSGAALELGFALRDSACRAGYLGIAAWVEPHKPEAGLARLLRLRQAGPLLHRYEVLVSEDDAEEQTIADAAGSQGHNGTITLDLPGPGGGRPMVDDLLGEIGAPQPHPDVVCAGTPPRVHRRTAIHWVLDRRRLVLSSFPCRSIDELPALISAMTTLIGAQSASALEIPVPAADLPATLFLASIKARRLSRTPVRLGRLDFATTSCCERPSADFAGDLDADVTTSMKGGPVGDVAS